MLFVSKLILKSFKKDSRQINYYFFEYQRFPTEKSSILIMNQPIKQSIKFYLYHCGNQSSNKLYLWQQNFPLDVFMLWYQLKPDAINKNRVKTLKLIKQNRRYVTQIKWLLGLRHNKTCLQQVSKPVEEGPLFRQIYMETI